MIGSLKDMIQSIQSTQQFSPPHVCSVPFNLQMMLRKWLESDASTAASVNVKERKKKKNKREELLSGDVSYVSLLWKERYPQKHRGEIYSISAGNYSNVNMTYSAPCVMRQEGNSPTLGRSATDATISISKAHTSHPHWHSRPTPLPLTPNTMSPSSLLSSASWLLSLSWSRCSVAIATEKCGNTSVLQNAGKGEGGGF